MPKQVPQGIISHITSNRRTDYLYRVSIKGLVRNEKGEVLVVKETGRNWWDLPGGGMDHGESIRSAIAREMKEEVNLSGSFTRKIIAIDEPWHLSKYGFWQIRLIFEITPENMSFSPGEDGDEVAFMNPKVFKDSAFDMEQRIYAYTLVA